MITNITNSGLNALLRCLAGDTIVFSKVQIGNGAPQDIASVGQLSNPIMDLPIISISVQNNYAALKTVIDNSQVTSTFLCTEVAIWAQSQDDPEQEILYAYGYESEAEADKITKIGNGVLQTEMEFMAFISTAEDISAVISDSMVFASAADLKAHMEDTKNPHAVTKAQVGLGNVPNVRTNDQTPTYATAQFLVELKSGEKLGTALGKISRAILTMINHLKHYENPHEVTAEQIEAAPAVHEHGATDIKSGTLGVPRGGTGKSSWTANRILYASGAATLTQLPFPTENAKVLMQDKSGAPYWGTAATVASFEDVTKRVKSLEDKSRINSSGYIVLTAKDYGSTLPAPGTPGRLFFKVVG